MKILVVGAKGQVGKELRSALGCLVARLGERPQVKFSSREDLDLTDLPRIPQYLDFVSPDIIVNAAAYTDVDMAEGQRELAFLVNEGAVKELTLFCEQRIKSRITSIKYK